MAGLADVYRQTNCSLVFIPSSPIFCVFRILSLARLTSRLASHLIAWYKICPPFSFFRATSGNITLRNGLLFLFTWNQNKSKSYSSCTLSVSTWDNAIAWLKKNVICMNDFSNTSVMRKACFGKHCSVTIILLRIRHYFSKFTDICIYIHATCIYLLIYLFIYLSITFI